MMREHDIGAIPIGASDKLVGVVSGRVCKGLADGRDVERLAARDVMTWGYCCGEDDGLADAVRHMEELQIRRLPVINGAKRMVGILSLGDISRTAPRELVVEWARGVSAHH
jgi:CBS domain-containing protein